MLVDLLAPLLHEHGPRVAHQRAGSHAGRDLAVGRQVALLELRHLDVRDQGGGVGGLTALAVVADVEVALRVRGRSEDVGFRGGVGFGRLAGLTGLTGLTWRKERGTF